MDKYSDDIDVKVSPEEKKKLQEIAKAKGYKNLSAFVRDTLLGVSSENTPEPNPEEKLNEHEKLYQAVRTSRSKWAKAHPIRTTSYPISSQQQRSIGRQRALERGSSSLGSKEYDQLYKDLSVKEMIYAYEGLVCQIQDLRDEPNTSAVKKQEYENDIKVYKDAIKRLKAKRGD
jgi:hypothetical protein